MDEEYIAYLERRNTELALIAEMTQMVSATLDPAEIEGMVLDTALQLTGARQCVLWVPLEGAAGWRRLVGTGVGEYRTESGDPQSDLLVWHILQEGRAVAGRDLPEVAERPELVSSLGLPLGNKGEFLAPLTVAGLPFPEHSDDYLETLSLMAAPAALALRNARRYTELQRRERELDARQRIMQTILRTLDLDERLTIALEETIRLLEAEIGGIYLAEGQRLLLRVHRGFSDEYLAYVGDLALADTSWASQATLHREHLREKTPPSAEVRRTFTEADKRAGVQAWVSVPLQVEEHLIGALVLASHRYDAFTADQVRALSALADQVAMAVQDAHLYTQARQRLARLTTLREIDRAIISHLELEEIIGVVLERVRPHLGVDAVGLSLIDWEKKCTTLAHFRFPDGTKIGADAFSLSDNLLEWLGRRQEPVLIYDLARDPRVANERGLIRCYGLVSYLGVPLVVQAQTIGVLHLLTTQPHLFSDEEVEFFTTVGGQAAIAIRNAQLYQAAVQRGEEFSFLYDAGLVISSALSLQEALNRVFAIAMKAVGAERAGFFAYDEEKEEFRVEIALGFPDELAPQAQAFGPLKLGQAEGVVGLVGQTQQILNVAETRTHPGWVPVDPAIRSALFISMVHEGRLLGVFNVASTRPGAFSPEQEHLLTLFINQVAVAIENARLFAETQDARDAVLNMLDDLSQAMVREQTRAKELEFMAQELAAASEASDRLATQLAAINRLDHIVSSSLDLDEIYRAFGEESSKIIPFDRMSVALVEGDQVRVLDQEIGMETGLGAEWVFPLAGSGIEVILQSGQPLIRRDLVAEERYPQDRQLIEAGLRSAVLMPLAAKGRVLGTFNVGSCQVNAYSEKDLAILQPLADQLAIAIDNARLYSSLQESNVQLQVALQAKNEMIQNVSHELRTPLAIMMGFVEMWKEGAFGPLTPEQEHIVTILDNQSKRLRFMVERLLILQTLRPESLQKVQLEPGPWLRGVVGPWVTRTGATGVEVHVDVSSDLPPVMADPDLLEQVIVNLLDNAIKFSPGGGVVQVRAWVEGDQVIIAVTDQGIGIPPDKLGRIFERFYQVDGSTSRRFGGMGIGLALCKAIVGAHGGRIWAESEGEGRGSTFYIALPL